PGGDRYSSPRAERSGSGLCELPVAVEREQIVAGGDSDPAACRKTHLEDPIRRPFVPTRNRVVAHLEGFWVEPDYRGLHSALDDLADRSLLEAPIEGNEDGLGRGQARVDQEAETA